MNFQFAPGMPGYGTKGIDGSSGLPGIATYFSSFSGSNNVVITPKIIGNFDLMSTTGDVPLPGPNRVYQTGDIFIDPDAKIYRIDLSLSNKFVDTLIALNTSPFVLCICFKGVKITPSNLTLYLLPYFHTLKSVLRFYLKYFYQNYKNHNTIRL